MFHVTYRYFLTVTDVHGKNPSLLAIKNVSRQNPCFIDGYERFFVNKKTNPTNGAFCQNPSLPLFFPSLLLAYNAIGSGLFTFQSVRHSNGFH